MKITKNFCYAEFFRSSVAEQKGISNVPHVSNFTIVCDRVIRLAIILQVARDYLGFPLTISSGFRCPALNDAVHGVKNSYHLRGAAADIPYTDETKYSIQKSLEYANKMFDLEQERVLKIIDEHGWFHVQLNDFVLNWSLLPFINQYQSLCATNR